MLNILIISDEAKGLASLFKSTGFTPDTQDLKEADRAAQSDEPSDKYDIAFLDLDAENWRERLLDARHSMPVIAFSRPDLQKAVEALKLGAGDYLEKPLTTEAVSEVIARHQKRILSHKYGFDEIIGNSRPMQEVFGLIKKAARS
jgi:DNA-binding NtrC family response regulator